ncbi:MAG: hypothetical protein ACT4QF_09230 [Sporichthyaceae bacterium]
MGMLVGIVLVLSGSFLAIIGLVGAIGSGLQLKLLPGRSLLPIAALPGAKRRVGERVVIRGAVAAGPGATVRAPLSGVECVWYLTTQTADNGQRVNTIERYSPQPFVLQADGASALVGPTCPALEQIKPVFRETRPDPHPWFDEAPDLPGEIHVYEFVLTGGEDLLAAGELSLAGGTPALTGPVTLSAGGDAAALGDPVRSVWQRDLRLAVLGAVLIAAGSGIISVADKGENENYPRSSSVLDLAVR